MLLRAGDTISGQQATATANIDGSIENMFYAKNIEATITKRKSVVRALGKNVDQNKSVGWAGAGSMSMQYMTSLFRKQMLKFIKGNGDTYFTLTVTNEDTSSTVGKQTTVLYNVNIDSVIVAKFDVDSDALDESIDFTFEGMDILNEFGDPII